MRYRLIAAAILVGVVTCAATKANTVTGFLWHVPEAVAQNAVPANVPDRTPDLQFSVDSPLNLFGISATVGDWLSSNGAFAVA